MRLPSSQWHGIPHGLEGLDASGNGRWKSHTSGSAQPIWDKANPVTIAASVAPHDHTYTRTANIALASVAYCAPSEQAAPQCRTFGTHGEILSKVSLARNDMFFQYDTCISPPLHQPFYNTFEHSNVEKEVLQVHLQQPRIFFLCQKCINLPIDGLFCENCAMTCGCLRLERQACTNPGWFRWHPVVVGLYDVVQECWQYLTMLYYAVFHLSHWHCHITWRKSEADAGKVQLSGQAIFE